MEERSESSKAARSDKPQSGNSRKSKKRSSRKNSVNMENWCEEPPINHNGAPQPAMDYHRPMFWPQPTVPQHVQPHHNGQRLFAAMSDPSVCGYSAMPMAYAMEPVSVPPMYPVYQPVSRPNYRAVRGRPRRNMAQNHHIGPQGPMTMTNGYSSLQEHRSNYSTPLTYQNGDYASLPPTANNDPINNGEELNSEHRRYSDPGLGPADLAHNPSEDSDSGESGSSITTIGKNNKLVLSLVEQMTAMRETNSKMFKELHETKFELENMKSEMARLKHSASSDYQPGMLSDIVREMREANKALDEAMITKVNAMVDDQNRQRTVEFEKLRDQLAKITDDKEDTYRRIAKLEDEVASLKLNANNEGREIAAFEEENLALRRELQEARASRNLAENHAAKCVSVVSSPLTPVNFETPCITSTPVRTELRDAFISNSLARPGPSTKVLESLTRNSPFDPRANAKESLCRRDSTSASPHDIHFYRAFQSNSPSSSPPSSPSNSSRNDDRDSGAVEIDEEWRWKAATADNFSDEPAGPESLASNSSAGKNSAGRNSRNANHVDPRYHHESTENIYTEIEENVQDFEETDNTERLMIFPTIDEDNHTDSKKSRARKSGNTGGKRVYQIPEKTRRSSSVTSNCSVGSSASSAETPDVVDERSIEVGNSNDSPGEGKKCRKRAITEVPDVIVVAGKPVVPKDLCSTRILTSRVLTRATYTTAYI